MVTTQHIQTNFLSQDGFEQLYQIVIDAYARTEREVWGENYVRVSRAQFQQHIADGEIIAAFIDNEIVGGVRVFELEDHVWSFSLLGASTSVKGKGVGRQLINAVEKHALANFAKTIRIEVLRAQDIPVASKVILHQWYERLGYRFVKSVDVFEVYDDAKKWAKLVNPSIFDCYQKDF